MRINVKLFAGFCLAVLPYTCLLFWRKCDDASSQDQNFYRERYLMQGGHNDIEAESERGKLPYENKNRNIEEPPPPAVHDETELKEVEELPPPLEDIDCLINGEYTVSCRRDATDEVYMPFSFIAKYFEVYGNINEGDNGVRFEWKHSHSRVYAPSSRYTPQGVFMSFDHYNVEVRDRVKCITGIEGVPLSTQWGPEGYFYPIQIAQYGLSHYSRYLTSDTDKDSLILQDAESGLKKNSWRFDSQGSSVTTSYQPSLHSTVFDFTASESLSDEGISYKVGATSRFFLSFDFHFMNNGSFTVYVEPKGKQPETYAIHYVCSNKVIVVEGNHIYYGIGDRKHWSRITRDIAIDFHKGLALKQSATQGGGGQKKKSNRKVLHKIVRLELHGRGQIDNITLSATAHLAQFYYAANWLVLNQDHQGGWPNMVTRKLAGGSLSLDPGWYSAMAQGQAMSLLIRAYLRTGNKKYLQTAQKATFLFDTPSSEGGILARFMDRYNWYEEYPTVPSSYVLNGFIYALIGLYDLKTIGTETSSEEHAAQLYEEGIRTLRAMLPLFDTGSGSVYDLRHFTLGIAPNLARWDYHATHINQLLLLATVEEDSQLFESTAKRWMDYMKGKRAPHN